MKFKCWCDSVDYEDAKDVEANDSCYAAEKYADRIFSEDPFNWMIVYVRERNGEISTLRVEAQRSVTFRAWQSPRPKEVL